MNTEHMSRPDKRAVEHITDPRQLTLRRCHYDPNTPHPHAGGGSRE
jgi:hypothetical protein